MTNKNRYYNRSRIAEKAFRRIICYFSIAKRCFIFILKRLSFALITAVMIEVAPET